MRDWIGINPWANNPATRDISAPRASREVSFKNPDDAEVEALAAEADDEEILQDTMNSNVSLEQTTYDAFVAVIICTRDENYYQHHGQCVMRMWLFTAILLHIIVISAQLTIVFYLLVTTAQTGAKPFRHGTEEKTGIILAAAANQMHLHIEEQPMELCEQMDVLQGGHLLIQIVWAARMLQEFADATWRSFYIHALQRQYSGSSCFIEEGSDGQILIVHASPCIAWMLLVVSSLPQCLCAGLLWWTGAKFLFFAHSMGVLVMKAISIAFITTLDEMMFKSFASQGYKDVVNKSQYLFTTVEPSRHVYMWISGIVKFVTAVVLASFVYWGVFGHVTAFRSACWQYWQVFPADIPNRGNESLWTTFLKGLEIS